MHCTHTLGSYPFGRCARLLGSGSIGLNKCECRVRIGREQEGSRRQPVRRFTLLLLGAVVTALTAVPQAHAQDFYRGKSLTLFAGQPPGGGIDSEMRLVAPLPRPHSHGAPPI